MSISLIIGVEKIGQACSRALTALRSARARMIEPSPQSIRVEQSVNFCPYKASSRKRPRKGMKPVKLKVFCLANKDCPYLPKTAFEKLILGEAGLGNKEIEIPADCSSQRELRDLLVETFPCLKEGGGFELLRCLPNSTKLELIPSEFCITPRHLKACVGNGKVYIRPIQKDLDTCTEDSRSVEVSIYRYIYPLTIKINECMLCDNAYHKYQLIMVRNNNCETYNCTIYFFTKGC